MIEEDRWFLHFMIGAMLILAMLAPITVGFILWSIWSAGFGVFVLIMSILLGFCWTVHRLPSSEFVKDKLEEWM